MKARARDLMTREVLTIGPKEPLHELVGILAAGRVGSLPVVERGCLLGIVSQADVVRALALEGTLADWLLDTLAASESDNDASRQRAARLSEFVASRLVGKTVENLMHVAPISVRADDEVREVARRLRDHRIHHAPVLEDGRFVGIVSTFDLTDWIAREA